MCSPEHCCGAITIVIPSSDDWPEVLVGFTPVARLPKRIAACDLRKAAEVLVQRQDLVHAVLERQSHEVRVVNEVAGGIMT